MEEVQDFINDMSAWSVKTFGNSDALPVLHHLAEEVQETIDAIQYEPNGVVYEFADCFILLMQAAKKYGLSFRQLFEAAKAKQKINKGRTWGTPDVNGVCKHVNPA